jgi:multidrug efflux pump
MDKERLYILESMPVGKAILTLAVPSVVSMLVQVFYNITDTFFVGKLNDPAQMAAVSVCLPLFMMQMAVSGIFGNGAASYISRQLGQKDHEGARRTATVTLATCFAASILLGVLGLVYLDPVLRLAGAGTSILPYAKSYMGIILAGSPIMMLNFAMAQILRSEGAARGVMQGNLIGTLTNIVLDPVFIFLLHMGVAGAAVATLIGAGSSLLWFLSFYWRRKSLALPAPRYLQPSRKIYAQIFKIGIPSSLSQIMMSIGNSVCYNVAGHYGNSAVAAFGVVFRVFSLPVFTFIGLSIALQPLVGYSYGANNKTRLKKLVRTALEISGVLSAFFLALYLLFPRWLVTVFIQDQGVVDLGSKALSAFTFAIPFIALQMPLMTSLQAMGKGFPSLIISLSRNGLVYIPAVFALNSLFSFGGLVWALPISDAISAMLATAFFLAVLRKLKYHHPEPELIKHALEEAKTV